MYNAIETQSVHERHRNTKSLYSAHYHNLVTERNSSCVRYLIIHCATTIISLINQIGLTDVLFTRCFKT